MGKLTCCQLVGMKLGLFEPSRHRMARLRVLQKSVRLRVHVAGHRDIFV